MRLYLLIREMLADTVTSKNGGETIAQQVSSWRRTRTLGCGQHLSCAGKNIIQTEVEFSVIVYAPSIEIDMPILKTQWLGLNHMAALFAFSRRAIGKLQLTTMQNGILYLMES